MRCTRFMLLFLSGAFLFSSCSGRLELEKRRYRSGYAVERSPGPYETPGPFTAFSLVQKLRTQGLPALEKKAVLLFSGKKPSMKKNTGCSMHTTLVDAVTGFDEDSLRKDSLKVLAISSRVGEVIDSSEKARYHLFPFWNNADFVSAQFFLQPDHTILIVEKKKDGSIQKMPCSVAHYNELAHNVFNEAPVLITNNNDPIHSYSRMSDRSDIVWAFWTAVPASLGFLTAVGLMMTFGIETGFLLMCFSALLSGIGLYHATRMWGRHDTDEKYHGYKIADFAGYSAIVILLITYIVIRVYDAGG